MIPSLGFCPSSFRFIPFFPSRHTKSHAGNRHSRVHIQTKGIIGREQYLKEKLFLNADPLSIEGTWPFLCNQSGLEEGEEGHIARIVLKFHTSDIRDALGREQQTH